MAEQVRRQHAVTEAFLSVIPEGNLLLPLLLLFFLSFPKGTCCCSQIKQPRMPHPIGSLIAEWVGPRILALVPFVLSICHV
jgi:hypothetical protein